MDRITSMRAFARAAQLGSLSAAARQMDISPAMAAKHVDALEARLSARAQESDNITAAYVGQLEDQLHRRGEPKAVQPVPPVRTEPELRL